MAGLVRAAFPLYSGEIRKIAAGFRMLSTGFQLAAARALVGMAQESLAKVVGLSTTTIRNMEASREKPIAGRSQSVQAVQRALEASGVLFLVDEAAGGVGVRMSKRDAQSA
jgi:hypothetical protein